MRLRATLTLDTGASIQVEVETDDLARDAFVVRRQSAGQAPALVEVARKHLRTAKRHPDGTADRLRAGDVERPF